MMHMPAEGAASAPTIPHVSAQIAEPVEPGTTMTYLGGRPLRRYLIWYIFGSLAWTAALGVTSGILIPNQVQALEFARIFTGVNAHVDLTALENLKNAVAAGKVATPDQRQLLGFFAQFDASRAQSLSLVSAIGTLVTMFVGPIVGVLSDRTRSRLGRRAPWLLTGAIAGASFIVLLRFAPTIALLALFSTVMGGAVNIAAGPLSTTIADRVPESKRGIASTAGGLGNIFGPLLGLVFAGAVFSSLGLNIYFILAVVLVVGLVNFVAMNRDRSSTTLQVPPHQWGAFFRGFLVPLRDSDYRWVWISRVVLFFGYFTSTTLSFFMLQSYIQPALSTAEATRTVPLLSLAGLPALLIAMAISGWLSDKIGRRKPFVIAASLLMAVSMAFPLLSPTLPALFGQTVLVSFAFGMYIPVDQALFIDVLPDKNAAGRDLGIAAMAIVIGQALAPILAGQVVALTGGYTLVWVVGLVLVLISAIAIVPVKRAR